MWKRLAFTSLCLLVLGKPVPAQSLNDIIRCGIQRGMREAALYEWRKLPSAEIACIEQNLHRQGLSVDALANRGIRPSDSRFAQLLSDCRNQFAQTPQVNSTASSPYVVDGLSLGGQVQPNSQAYQRYQCGPSDKFHGFTWCHEEHTSNEHGNDISLSHSILHSQDGTAGYTIPEAGEMVGLSRNGSYEPRGGRRDGHALSRRPYFRIICVDGVGLCDQSIACARRACRRCQSGGAAAFRSVRSHRFRLVNQRGPYNVTNYSNPARDKIIPL